MPDHFDRLENRTPAARETTSFRDLRHILAVSKPRAQVLRAQLKGINPATITTRAELAAIPILRRHDLLALQAETAPFGGLSATRLGLLKQIFVDGGMASLEGKAKDWWGMGRALFAAGLRKGTLVLNCFPYDLMPHGHIAASGACAIGCPVIPAGGADIALKAEAVSRLHPPFFCGPADHLKALLDHGDDRKIDLSSLKDALVTGTMSAGLRSELSLRGLNVRCVFMLPEVGVIAYESGATEGLTVNEGLIVEIVDRSGKPVPPGQAGEVVVTRLNTDYPLLRYGTGFFSTALGQPATCGRTNMRIRAPVDTDSADCTGSGLRASHLAIIARRHPHVGRIRAVLRRLRERDELFVRIEHRGNETSLSERVLETLRLVTRMPATVEIVEPGTLTDDEGVIVDERHLN